MLERPHAHEDTVRRHQTCDFGEHATSAPAKQGKFTTSREIELVRRFFCRPEVARLWKWHMWCLLVQSAPQIHRCSGGVAPAAAKELRRVNAGNARRQTWGTHATRAIDVIHALVCSHCTGTSPDTCHVHRRTKAAQVFASFRTAP